MPLTGVPRERVGAVVQSYITRDNEDFVGAEREGSSNTYTVGPMTGARSGGGTRRGVAAVRGGSSGTRGQFTGENERYEPPKTTRKRKTPSAAASTSRKRSAAKKKTSRDS